MTPKEKAVELVNKFGRQFALEVVDEIFYYNSKESMNDYWIEVKQEIEKL